MRRTSYVHLGAMLSFFSVVLYRNIYQPEERPNEKAMDEESLF